MCDQETRKLFGQQKRREWTNTIMLSALLGIAGWMALQTFNQGKAQVAEEAARLELEHRFEEHRKDFARLIAIIPDGFFTDKTRYGKGDAHDDQEHNRREREADFALIMAEIKLMDRRIQFLEKLSTKHIGESAIYIQIVKDTAINVKEIQKIIWKLMPDG